MSRPLYPVLPGWGFSVIKAPHFSTRVQKAISGRELRIADQLYPIYEFTLTYEFLRDKNDTRGPVNLGLGQDATNAYDELRTLMGFFIQQQGSFSPFLFDDSTDNKVTAGVIGTGDGSTTVFQLVRAMGNFKEPITAIKAVTQVYLNGTPAAAGSWFVDANSGLLTFGQGAPAFGTSITADFTYYFLCRFKDDSVDFEYFLYQLWSAKEIKLRSVLNEELIMTPSAINWWYLDLPPTSGNEILFWVAGVLTTIPPNFVGSYFFASVAATADTTFSIQRNSIQFATVDVPIGATQGVFSASSETTFNPGDFLTIVPNRSDATLSGLGGVIAVLQ